MKIGLIGAGKMAEAMIGGFLSKRLARPDEIMASEVSASRRKHLRRQLGIQTVALGGPVVEHARTIILAVKPQDLGPALEQLSGQIGRRHLVISIAAGRKIEWLQDALPDARIARVMPNLACVVGESMSAYAMGARTRPSDGKTTERLLRSCGEVIELPEEEFDAVTALSGSGPAFYAYFTQQLIEAAVSEGLSRDTALILARQTMLGTGAVLKKQDADLSDFIDAVSSAKGTTAAGMQVLNQSSIPAIVRKTIRAAARRSRELSEE
ncbi:MAG: pyrroline-5-carboxylate reductase [Verrucomicrobia bacterium]|nr:pyrroline-5-carboxylate reductase [Verrucomicrobiota bacterium]MDA1088085.1 pyrroline-5-carboxylate reductase [Verrucomicrobiota bacterium]